MEDPWATASAPWSTPAKASTSTSPPPNDRARLSLSTPPPPSFDVNDPWGAPPPSQLPTNVLPGEEAVKSPTKGPSTDWGYNEGLGGWGESASAPAGDASASSEPVDNGKPSPIPPPKRLEQHQAVWSLDSPAARTIPLEADFVSDSPSAAALPTSPKPPSTPPRNASFPSLESLSSPALSDHSFAAPSPTPSFHDHHAQGFGSPSRLPRSPSFPQSPGEFGGFSGGFSGDPWGGGGEGGGFGEKDTWGGDGDEERRESLGFGQREEEEDQDQDHTYDDEREGEEGGWGAGRARAVSVPRRVDTEWEDAQRKIRLKEERAPPEKIRALQEEWMELSANVIGLDKIVKLTDEEEGQLEAAVRKLSDGIVETLRTLSTVPTDINTYPPVLSSLETNERYLYALKRPNPTPSTSLLTISQSRRTRQTGTLGFTATLENTWTNRSKLGEPDAAPPMEVSTSTEETGKAGWSFWGRKAAPSKPLVTSGGGLLEAKTIAPTTTVPVASVPAKAPAFPVMESSPSMTRAGSTISVNLSRPASPARPASFHEDVGHSSPNETLPGSDHPAPSAVSRFFGKLSRRPTSQNTPAVDVKDLELSSDDFSFLAEVPAINSKPLDSNIGDLLALGGEMTQPIALDAMLASRPPPPRGMSARTVSSSSVKFVAKMKAPAASDMDLLSGLYSDDTTPPMSAASTSSAWDDFMAPAPMRTNTPPIVLSPPPVSSAPPSRMQTLPPPLTFTPPPSNRTSVVSPPASSSRTNDDFADFADFGTPQAANDSSFDDFGDFSAFNAPTPVAQFTSKAPLVSTTTPSRPSQSSLAQHFITPAQKSRLAQLDHTPTISLVNSASSLKGRRWPAPPSPVLPVLEPPPKAPGSNVAFPFLSPPPPPVSRPPSGLASSTDLIGSGSDYRNNLSGFGMQNLAQQATVGMIPAAPPLQVASSVPPPGQASVPKPLSEGKGLSAQDLSFFDSL